MIATLTLPRLGETMEDGRIAGWLKKPGERFKRGETIVEIETDKAVAEMPAVDDGIMIEILAEAGETLKVGQALCRFDDLSTAAGSERPVQSGATETSANEPAVRTIVDVAAETAPVNAAGAPTRLERPRATPHARRLAREHGLVIGAIVGTGRRSRIESRDVEAAVAGANAQGKGAAPPQLPAIDFAKFGPIESVPLSRIQRISGPRLHASWVNIPHVTHCDEADVTELDAFRKRLDDEAKADKAAPYRVSLLPLLMTAAVATLKAFPPFNAALAPAKDALILRRYWHIGVAVDTPDGLVVAVIRDVDQKGVVELARELGTLSAKAREGKLTPTEMQGATFTVSSLGGIGGTAFTPIVNAPEVAILGVVRAKMAPVWDGEAFRPRLMLPLCLSYDHRVIDGAAAARFTRHFCGAIEDMRRVLL